MAKPINRSKQRKSYFLAGIASYIAVLFVGLHIGRMTEPGGEVAWIAGIQHIQEHPFDIFPINMQVMGPFALLGLIPGLLLYSEYLRKRDLRMGEEKGSARWTENLKGFYKRYTQTRSKLPSFVRKTLTALSKIPILGTLFKSLLDALETACLVIDERPGNNNMIFSNDIAMNMDGRKTRRNNNVVLFGGSGTGKSRFYAKPNILQANASYVITDPSGELLLSEGKFLEEQGYDVKVFNLTQMEHSHTYNPFHYIRNESGVLTMINALIRNTTSKGASSSDPFWEKAETALLEAICFYLQSEVTPDERNFANVMRLLQLVNCEEGKEDADSPLDIMFNDLAAREPQHIAVRQYKVFKSAGKGKTAQSILISCQTRLQHFNLSDVIALTSTDQLDLGSIGDKKTALFIVTPVADTSFNFLAALLYTQMFETLYYRAETDYGAGLLPVHVRCILDEFANIGTIPDFDNKLATMRKYGISCTIILQAMSQLKKMYKDEWEVIIGNCDSFFFIGGSDETTLKYVSNKLGKETIRAVNNSQTKGRQGSYSISYNKDGRELMTQDELSTMDNDNCVLFIRGEHPFMSTKYKLERHPNYKLSGDYDKSKQYDVKQLETGKAPAKSDDEASKAVQSPIERKVNAAVNRAMSERAKEEKTPAPALVTEKGERCLAIRKEKPLSDESVAQAVDVFNTMKELRASAPDVYVHVPEDPNKQQEYLNLFMSYMDEEEL